MSIIVEIAECIRKKFSHTTFANPLHGNPMLWEEETASEELVATVFNRLNKMPDEEVIEKLARQHCERMGVDPDFVTYGIGRDTIKKMGGNEYRLWQYHAVHYIKPIIEDYLNEART